MHLYLHVPFCQRRCSYCDFSIAVRKTVPAREYVEAIQAEVRGTEIQVRGSGRREAGSVTGPTLPASLFPPPVPTIYFGGGTPSLLPPDAISTLLHDTILDALPVDGLSLDAFEVTLEANPEDVSPVSAEAWRRAGVNRISLGSQSFDDRVLRWMHRVHDAARIGESVRTLRAAGFDNLSLDLIFALPEDLGRDWGRDLDQALALEPEHLSLYGLTVEERTPLARWVSRGAALAPDDDRYADEYLLAHERLAAGGYEFYEVSNAARAGRISRHNSAYWTGRPYLGLGPAAHSFDGRRRSWNRRAWEEYRRAVSAGESPVESEEVLTEEQGRIESVYLGLRTRAGVPGAVVPSDRLKAWVTAGWAVASEGRIRLTAPGWLLLDTLVRDLTGAPSIL